MNELLIDFESAIGIKQQLDNMDKRIHINKNNIDSLSSKVQSMNSKLAQIDPAMIKSNFQKINSIQDTVRGLQTNISNNVKGIQSLNMRINGIQNEIVGNIRTLSTIHSTIEKMKKDIRKNHDSITGLHSSINTTTEVYVTPQNKVTVKGISGFENLFTKRDMGNPFIFLENQVGDYINRQMEKIKGYVNSQVTSLSDAMHKTRNVKFTGYSFSYSSGFFSNTKYIIRNAKNISKRLSISNIESGINDILKSVMSPYLSMQNAINAMIRDVRDNFNKVRNLGSNFTNLHKDLEDIKSNLPSNLTLGVNASFSELQKVLKALNSGVNVNKVLNFRDIMQLKHVYDNFITKIYTENLSIGWVNDAFGMVVGPGWKPFTYAYIKDDSWHTSKSSYSAVPIATLAGYVSDLVIDRIGEMVSSNSANAIYHMQRQLGIIFHLINGYFTVLKEVSTGSRCALYAHYFKTPDGKQAGVTLRMGYKSGSSCSGDKVYVGQLPKIIKYNVGAPVNKLVDNVQQIKSAFDYMRWHVPTNFNLNSILKIANNYGNALKVDLSGNAISELNSTISKLKTQLTNMQKEMTSIKSKLDKLEHN